MSVIDKHAGMYHTKSQAAWQALAASAAVQALAQAADCGEGALRIARQGAAAASTSAAASRAPPITPFSVATCK